MSEPAPGLPPMAIDSPRMREAGRELVSLALMDSRNQTLQLLARWSDGVGRGVAVPEGVDPPLWTAGHIGWLAERWIVRNPHRAQGLAGQQLPGALLPSARPWADALFDPALAPPGQRASLALPDAQEIRQWLLETLEATLELLERADESDAGLHGFRAALFHEDACAERLVAAAQAAGLHLPLAPPPAHAVRDPIWLPAVRWMLGSQPEGFSFDLERPAHTVDVPEFEIDAQPVDWARFVEFVDDGGYDQESLWQPEGWQWLQAQGRRSPACVDQIGVASGAVMQTWFGRATRMAGGQPALHVSWWEADAWARWAGRRLPTEVEWEVAACTAGGRGWRWGAVHEWTAGRLRPWDGWQPDPWSVGTLFDPQPFWGRARVLRGASFATRARLKHPRRRGFALPGADQGFFGFRTCAA